MTVRSKTSPSSHPQTQDARREVRSTPFKRGRSKVFYASDMADTQSLLPQNDSFSKTAGGINSGTNDSEKNNKRTSNSPLWRNTLGTCKETNEANSSGDETASPSNSSIRSPIGSLRSSLGGSLRGSQDSGYSDSGESNSGGTPELDPVESPPRVKHISRVFFGSGSGRAKLYSDTIVTSSTVTPVLSHTPSVCNSNSLPRRRISCSTQVESTELINSARSSPTSMCESDEPQYEMETKSILDISSGSYDEEASRKTGAIRKSTYITSHRKTRRSTSADKLLEEPKARRPCILKAKRRWSNIDMKSPVVTPITEQSSYFPKTLPSIDKCSSLGTVPETILKPIESDHCLSNTLPRKANVKRLRIHPVAIASEMK